ncbi:PAS domain S-box protein, partial [bacterium]|nr:PAS domain S-box protein [bacterium]
MMKEIGDAEKRFEVLDNLPLGVFVLRQDFTVVFWNRCLEDWSSVPRNKIVGTNIESHFSHFKDSKYKARLQTIFEGGLPTIFSSQLHKNIIPAHLPGGKLRIQQTTVTSLKAGQRGKSYALFAIEDVTELTRLVQDFRTMRDQALDEVNERKKAQEELAAGEALYRALTETIPHVIWLGESDGHVTYLNKAYKKLTGRSLRDTLGFGWAEDIHPDDKDTVLQKWEDAYKQSKDYRGECRFRAKDGSYRTVSYTGTPVKDESGKVVQWIGVNTDISELKQAEQALRVANDELEKRVQERTAELQRVNEALKESEERYQRLYDAAPDMFASVDPETAMIRQCNQTLATNLGYSKAEIIGRPIFDVYHPDCMEEVQKAFDSFVKTGEVHNAELQLQRKNGSKIDVILNVSTVRDEQGNILYSSSIWRD